MSYKFQRLRERLRQAVTSGELKGKLPGERALAKMYNCNAKTLSKALTDLAAEGLLDRSIGRGTYVKGSAPTDDVVKAWLVLGNGVDVEQDIVSHAASRNAKCQLVVGEPSNRPSFVNQFSAVIDASGKVPESFLRDLVVRAMPLVAIGCEPRTFSLDCVLVDVCNGAAKLAREGAQIGHRRVGVVETTGSCEVTKSVRHGAGSSCTVDSLAANDVVAAASDGVTLIVCSTPGAASKVMSNLAAASISVPGQVSVVAVGLAGTNVPCTGAYVRVHDAVDQAIALLSDRQPRRPATLWMAPTVSDHGTLTAPHTRTPIDLGLAAGAMLGS